MQTLEDLSLVSLLFKIINNEPEDQPDSVLARYFLENWHRLGQMATFDLADECFVSKSSIRRFCQRLGFENFKELRQSFRNFGYEYSYFLYENKDASYYRQYLHEKINKLLTELEDLIPDSVLEDLAERIHQAKNVYILASYNCENAIYEFQRPMAVFGKVIKILPERCFSLEHLTEDDLLIVTSIKGVLARKVIPYLEDVDAWTVLLSTSHQLVFEDSFDQLLYLTSEDCTGMKTYEGKYGINVFFDLLFRAYMNKYGFAALSEI